MVGLVDPSAERAQAVLQAKGLTSAAQAYARTTIYPSIDAATDALTTRHPALVLLGSPPAYRGRLAEGLDAERRLVDAFPKSALFVEKPVSTGPVEDAMGVAQVLEGRKNIVSVGYMLRYSKAVQKMKEIIMDNGLTVMMTSARYVMGETILPVDSPYRVRADRVLAYEMSRKLAWWNKAVDCGPIVEQATHFCDLSRYFGGEVRLPSIMAHSLEWYEVPGQLSKVSATLSERTHRI